MRNDILYFKNSYLQQTASVVGKLEKDGPLGSKFDLFCADDRFDQNTWEKAETEMVKRTIEALLKKSGKMSEDIDIIAGGDLLDQCIATSHAVNNSDIPYLGLYGACSTAAEGLIIGSTLADKGLTVGTLASSHFCSAERQYRFPLEYGSQRTPTAQNTVTGCGAFLLSPKESKVKITKAVIGKIQDNGISDANNMGAAMATAAVDTLIRFLSADKSDVNDFDIIATGDLGQEGFELAKEYAKSFGLVLGSNYVDCGMLIYDLKKQSVNAGGSGCGCSAAVFAADICPKLLEGKLKNAVFIGTGALLSPKSIIQNKIIPSVAHLVCFERIN